MNLPPIEKRLNYSSIYKKLFSGEEGLSESLGWRPKSQEFRFKLIYDVGIRPGDSILDVGCGYGDLIDYLHDVIGCDEEVQRRFLKYKGIDVRQEAIDFAKKKHIHNNCEFSVGNIFDETNKFDWIVGSGIFCLSYKNWAVHTANTINRMYELSNKGVVVNFLARTKNEKQVLYYTNINELYNAILIKYKSYVIKYDENEEDITIYLYKQESK